MSAAATGGIHPDIVIEMMDQVLSDDPYSPNLLFAKALQEGSRGNMDGAKAILAKIEKLAPSSDERIIQLKEALK